MKESISSDFANLEMLADQAFNNILDGVQKSNLNFQMQVLPFSAFISLKKSLVKNKSGSFQLPPAHPTVQSPLPSPTMNEDIGKLLATIKELETDLLNNKNNNLEEAAKNCEDTSDKLKFYEEHSRKLEKENKALRQENKTLVEKLETKAHDINQLKTTVAELNKDKNVLNVALKSVKQDLKAQIKASEDKLKTCEKKLIELHEFKSKKLNEERQERIRKKKELRRETKKNGNNNNPSTTLAAKEEKLDEKKVEKEEESDISVEKKESCPSVAIGSDSSAANSKACVLDPQNKQSVETSEDKFRDIELEEKEEGFIGPRLPRMLTNEEVKALLDRLLGDKHK